MHVFKWHTQATQANHTRKIVGVTLSGNLLIDFNVDKYQELRSEIAQGSTLHNVTCWLAHFGNFHFI